MSIPLPFADPLLPFAATLDGAAVPDEAAALLRSCCDAFAARLHDSARDSLDLASDLFEATTAVPEVDVDAFRAQRGEWLERFACAISASFEQWQQGTSRQGRRPDRGASAATLEVMTPFDQEKQAALVEATASLRRFTRGEVAALGARLAELRSGAAAEHDNPFGPDYILDALGATSRSVYPNPRVWRPLMIRLLEDLTPAVNKIYISLNRTLADRGVLPGMKAALRARSVWRPADDTDLLPTFSKMLAEAGPPSSDTVAHGAYPGAASRRPDTADAAPASAILAGLAALAGHAARGPSRETDERPPHAGDRAGVDPVPANASSTPLFATLGGWQRIDLPAAIVEAMPADATGGAAPAVPQNLIPHIRAAVTAQVTNPVDGTAMDVVALLFDYVFGDASIPDRQRRLFGRLQVPIVKVAVLDHTFFSDRRHPARALLDHLADGAIGATASDAYGDAFEAAAAKIIDRVCRDFEADAAVFARADADLAAFLERERREAAPTLHDHVAIALAAEEGDVDRAEVRALVRDRLAGLEMPFEVRTFADTIWADYLTAVRKRGGAHSDAARAALATLDELLWSIEVKERAAQKARLMKLIPGLVGSLRRGCAAVTAPQDRTRPFFEALYALHMAALKPRRRGRAGRGRAGAPSPTTTGAPAAAAIPGNVHDFVSEMAVGTWLTFGAGAAGVNARLSWVSPLRSKYVFTSRSRTQAYVFSPEALAFELGSGRASLVVEPVALFDRAVSAALDSLAARKPRPVRAAA
ncbi:MAG TPA: DUF1631 family protein [Casimicrobiaceae bacterium]|nr:DUF1631 family protein [Casimicrobiaceae bacterium]